METSSWYTNKWLIFIPYCLKFLREPNIFMSLIWRLLFRVKPILNHPLPMTLRQLRRFLGVTGYCSIWILGYGELVWPLYLYFILYTYTYNWNSAGPNQRVLLVPRGSKGFWDSSNCSLKGFCFELPIESELSLFVTENKGHGYVAWG